VVGAEFPLEELEQGFFVFRWGSGAGHRSPSAGFSTETGCWSTTLSARVGTGHDRHGDFSPGCDGVGAAEVHGWFAHPRSQQIGQRATGFLNLLCGKLSAYRGGRIERCPSTRQQRSPVCHDVELLHLGSPGTGAVAGAIVIPRFGSFVLVPLVR